jgi:metallo-beta-lactamase family protein
MTVKLKFHGAARMVTGSCYMIETDTAKVLVDCGMFQGSRAEAEMNYRPFPFDPNTITALVLTHAHIDHTGLVPKLVKHGFNKTIFTTHGTKDLCGIMLPDSGFIQEMEVKKLNQRNARKGVPEVEPIYGLEDATAAVALMKGFDYEQWFSPVPGIRMRYWNAGHLLGSASIETEIDQAGKKPIRVLFSGDIGPDTKLLESDPEGPTDWDYVVCESTYGARDRLERSPEKRRELLAQEIKDAEKRGGVMLIPSFAVERTQEVVTDLVYVMDHKLAPQTNIFIDSPLASKATAIFRKHAAELENGQDLAKAFASPFVRATESVDESKALNRFQGFHIIISASGMCEAGRIRHHLRNRLWQKSTTVLLVGYQAHGSLGSQLEAGAKRVKIMGEDIDVAATTRKLDDYSGHADGPELVQWVKERLPIAKSMFLTHGEDEPQQALADNLKGMIPDDCILRPRLDDVFDLTAEKCALVELDTKPRLAPDAAAKTDWNNDLQNLMLDIESQLKKLPDAKGRAALVHKMRSALVTDQNERGMS